MEKSHGKILREAGEKNGKHMGKGFRDPSSQKQDFQKNRSGKMRFCRDHKDGTVPGQKRFLTNALLYSASLKKPEIFDKKTPRPFAWASPAHSDEDAGREKKLPSSSAFQKSESFFRMRREEEGSRFFVFLFLSSAAKVPMCRTKIPEPIMLEVATQNGYSLFHVTSTFCSFLHGRPLFWRNPEADS